MRKKFFYFLQRNCPCDKIRQKAFDTERKPREKHRQRCAREKLEKIVQKKGGNRKKNRDK